MDATELSIPRKDRVGKVLAVHFIMLVASALLAQPHMWLSAELSWLAARIGFFESMAAISYDPQLYLVHFGICVVVTVLLTPWFIVEMFRSQQAAGTKLSPGAVLFALLVGGLLFLILSGNVDSDSRDGGRGALLWLVLESRGVLATLGSIILTGFTTLYVMCLSPISLLLATMKNKGSHRA